MAAHNSFRTSERFAPFAIISNVRFSAACNVAVRFARSSKWLIFRYGLRFSHGMKRIHHRTILTAGRSTAAQEQVLFSEATNVELPLFEVGYERSSQFARNTPACSA